MKPPPRHRLWTALAAPPLAWFVAKQVASQTARHACAGASPPLGPLAGALALIVCGVAAALAWPFVASNGDESRDRSDAFIAGLALGAAGVFAIAVTAQALVPLLFLACAS